MTEESENLKKPEKLRAFTIKSFIAGFIGLFIVAAFGKSCVELLQRGDLLACQLGIGAFFYFFIICCLWNPLAIRLSDFIRKIFIIIPRFFRTNLPSLFKDRLTSSNIFSIASIKFANLLRNRLTLNFITRGVMKPLSVILPAKLIKKLGTRHKFTDLLNFKLNRKEIAIAMIMTLVAGGFSYVGWMRQLFTQTGLIPIKARTLTKWKQYNIFELFNPEIFPNSGVVDETVINGFNSGMGGKWLDITKVPFSGWSNLLYWGPLLIIISIMMLAVLMIIHRQWIKHEKLSYPIATIAESLLYKSEEKNCFADIFKSKLFWWGFGCVFFIHIYNYTAAWYPEYVNPIPTTWWLSGLSKYFPSMGKVGCWYLQRFTIFFMMIGISYFLSSALSMTIALNGVLYFIFASQIYYMTGTPPNANEIGVMRAGAYFSFAGMMLFLGRHFYGPVILQALGFRKLEDDKRQEVAAARIFLICVFGTVFLLNIMGLNIVNAILFTISSLIIFIVFTRIVCEGGIPFMQSGWTPIQLFPKLFGGAFIGPQGLMLKGLLSGILVRDPRQLLMPYMATGAKIGEDTNVRHKTLFQVMGLSIILAFAVAIIVNLWEYYSFGVIYFWCQKAGWNCGTNAAVTEISKLHINGQYEASVNAGFWESFALISPDNNFLIYFMIGVIGVLVLSFLRIRFLWFPVHAMLFCIWRTWPGSLIWSSFLVGWVARTLIVKFGGERNYIRLKPLFIGLIFGEICAEGVMLLISLIYYLVKGTACTVTYRVFVS